MNDIRPLSDQYLLVISSKQSSVFGILSTFTQWPIKIDNCTYKSPEHAIQVLRMKLLGLTEKSKQIARAKTPHQARRCGDSHFEKSCNPAQKSYWYEHQIETVAKVLSAYVDQYPEVRESLLLTGRASLIAFHQDNSRGIRDNIDGSVYTALRSKLQLENGRD